MGADDLPYPSKEGGSRKGARLALKIKFIDIIIGNLFHIGTFSC